MDPIEDFSVPPDCTTSGCATVSGTVKDKLTGKAVGGVHVAVPGVGLRASRRTSADTTDGAGHFAIANVPFHTYAEFDIQRWWIRAAHGREPARRPGHRRSTRRWSATGRRSKAERTVGKFTPPDYGPFGCGPEQLLDLNLGTGWGSDAVGSTEGSNNDGPRKVVIKLPKAVDITTFAVASNGACGDGPEAGVKKFKVETKTANGNWITAFVGSAQEQR